MCIAIAKNSGVKCPYLDNLRNCWDSNPDGAGFAFNDAGRVVIKKGFMTWNDFKTAWLRYSKRYDFDNRGVLIHFRISTHGGTNPQNTHPFPVIADTGMMQKSECVCDYAAIHNGIITMTSSQAYKERSVSDTLVFIRDYLSLIAQNKAWFKRRSNIELINLLIDAPSSKMAILNGRGEIIYTDGFTEDNGILYSNTSYKTPRVRSGKKYGNYPTCYNYDYDDDDYYGREYGYYNNGYGWGYGDDYYQNGSRKSFNATPANPVTEDNARIPLMRRRVGDTVRCENYEDVYIASSKDRTFCVSKEGYVYELADCSADSMVGDEGYDLSFCGSGCLLDTFARKVDFSPNFYAYPGQFLSECTPEFVNSWGIYNSLSVVDMPPIEEADEPDDITDLNATLDDKKKEENGEPENGAKGNETTATK